MFRYGVQTAWKDFIEVDSRFYHILQSYNIYDEIQVDIDLYYLIDIFSGCIIAFRIHV